MRDYTLTKMIPARKKMEFMSKAGKMESKKEIFDFAKKTAIFYGNKNNCTYEQTKTACLSLYACGLCAYNIAHATDVYSYMIQYINWKMRTYEKLNDLGSFGDSLETIVHLVACRELWRVRLSRLHVSALDKIDVTINGIKFEVGSNGKTWADSTEENAMEGKFDGVIYGVFTEEEKQDIINLFHQNKVIEGITRACNLLYVFTDKYAYLNFMNGISKRSETIQYKPHILHYQTIYNASKDKAFRDAIKNSGFITLTEYMKNLSYNDFIM